MQRGLHGIPRFVMDVQRIVGVRVKDPEIRTLYRALTWSVALCAAAFQAFGQAVISDEVRTGHHLASMLCDECHIAARDQAYLPTRDPPAPSFESIAQRKDVGAELLEHFLKTTHQGLDNPKGMENRVG